VTTEKIVRRRRNVAELRRVAESAVTAYVESPIQTVLASIDRVISTELAYMERAQMERSGPMSPAEAKKLSNLVGALEKSVSVGREISEKEGNAMDDAELERELTAELERIRAKRA
jgi:hypothetical protein